MKKVIIVLVIAVIGAAGYYAYKRFLSSDDLVKSIPSDAMFVAAIDPKSIAMKAGGKDIAELKMFKKMKEEMAKQKDSAAKSVMSLMDNATGSGLNVLNRFYVFSTRVNDKTVFGVVAGLLSAADFEKTLRTFPLPDSIRSEGDLKKVEVDREGLLAWNSKQVIFLGGTKMDALDSKMKALFNHSENSIGSISSFKKFNSKSMDFGMFFNYGTMDKLTGAYPNPLSIEMNDLYKDTYVDFVTNFETNSIVTKMDYYFEDSGNKDKLMVMNEKGIDAAHAKLITPKNILIAATMSANMDKFFGLFETMTQFTAALTEIQKQIGLNEEEMKKLLNGNVSIALVDFQQQVVQKPDYHFNEQTGQMEVQTKEDTTLMPIFTATLGINDWNAFNKLMKGTGLSKTGEYYTINTPVMNVFLVETKTGVTATNSKELVDNIAAKKELAELSEPMKSLVTNSASFYMDLNLKSYPDHVLVSMKSMMGPDGYTAFEKTMAIFKDIEMKAEGYSGTMEVKLNEGYDNSLHRMLVTIDNNIYPLIEKQQAEREERMHAYMMMDSIRAANEPVHETTEEAH